MHIRQWAPVYEYSPMLLLLVFIALYGHAIALQKTCDDLGFTGEQVCSDCEVLAQYVKDAELVADCKSCCIKDAVSVKYTKAEIAVDRWHLGALPQLKDFLDKRAKSYAPRLKVIYSDGMAPRLRLSGPAGSENVRIDNWKTATISEFLDERLERPAGSDKTATA